MSKPLKILLAVIGIVLLLLIGTVLAAIAFFDPNSLRSRLAEAVKKETGRELAIGEIRMGFFPWLNVEVDQLALGNAAGFGPAPMVSVESLRLGVRLLPLLREQRVEASTLRLSGVKVTLAVNAEGLNNWQDLIKPDKEKDETGRDASGKTALDIAGIEIENLALSYTDARSQAAYAIEGLQLKTGHFQAGEPFSLKGGFKATSAVQQAALTADFDTQAWFDDETGSVRLQDLRLKLDASQAGAAPLRAALLLNTAKFAYDGKSKLLSIAPLSIELSELLKGVADKPELTATGRISTALASDLGARQHSLKALDVALDLGGSLVPGGKPQKLLLKTDVSADLAADTAKLDHLQLGFAGLDASAELAVEQLSGEAPSISGPLSLAPFSPRALMATLAISPPQTADPAVLQQLSLKALLSATAKTASLRNLALKLDDTSITGDFSLRDFSTQALAFALRADSLDADRYLPPEKKPQPGESPAQKVDINGIVLPAELLEKLNAEGTLDFARLKLKGVVLSDARIKLSGGGKASIKRQQISAGLYGGRADIALDFSPGAKPGYGLNTALSGISAGPLLKDFLGKDYLSGQGSVTLALGGSGRTVGDLRRALNGDAAFNFVNGAVKGFNLGKIIRDGKAMLSLKPGAATAVSGSEPQSTDFAELRGAAKIVNGVLKSDQLSAKNPLLRLEGAGEINLVDETINYLAKPTLVSSVKGQGGKDASDLRGLVIPIRLTGGLFKPLVSIDWQAALQQQAAEQLRGQYEVQKEQLQQQREQIKNELKKNGVEGLLKLFGGKKAEPPAEPASAPK